MVVKELLELGGGSGVKAPPSHSVSLHFILGLTESVMGLQPLLFIAGTVKEVLELCSFACMLTHSIISSC